MLTDLFFNRLLIVKELILRVTPKAFTVKAFGVTLKMSSFTCIRVSGGWGMRDRHAAEILSLTLHETHLT